LQYRQLALNVGEHSVIRMSSELSPRNPTLTDRLRTDQRAGTLISAVSTATDPDPDPDPVAVAPPTGPSRCTAMRAGIEVVITDSWGGMEED